MKKKPTLKPQLTVEQRLARSQDLISRAYAKLGVACEALTMIRDMDWGCNHGSAKSGLALAGYVARNALSQIDNPEPPTP